MKLSEKNVLQDGKLIRQRTFDATPQIEQAKALRDAGIDGYSENKLIARIPNWLIHEWLKEAGVSHSDPAAQDVLRKKLLSGDADAFRVWKGTF